MTGGIYRHFQQLLPSRRRFLAGLRRLLLDWRRVCFEAKLRRLGAIKDNIKTLMMKSKNKAGSIAGVKMWKVSLTYLPQWRGLGAGRLGAGRDLGLQLWHLVLVKEERLRWSEADL